MSRETVTTADVGRSCPYCRFALKSGITAERCGHCGALHHDECWEDGGGCAVYGCAGAQSMPAAPATTTAPIRPHGPAAPQAQPAYAPPPPPAYHPSAHNASAPPDRGQGSSTRGILIGMGIAFAIVGAAIGGYFVASGGDDAEPVAQSEPAAESEPADEPANAAAAPEPTESANADEERVARELQEIVEFSLAGRADVVQGQYVAAIENRREVLRRIDGVDEATGELTQAKETLRGAMEASLDSDISYRDGIDASASDAEATRLKGAFVDQFSPVARRYDIAVYSADEF